MRMQMLRERLTACVAASCGHFWASAVTLYISKSASSSQHQKNQLFSEPPTYYWRKIKRTISRKLEINISHGSAAALCRWGGQINNICGAYFLNILCAKYCRSRSTYVDTRHYSKMNSGLFFYSCCILKILNNLGFSLILILRLMFIA